MPMLLIFSVDAQSVFAADAQKPLHDGVRVAAVEAGVADDGERFADQRRQAEPARERGESRATAIGVADELSQNAGRYALAALVGPIRSKILCKLVWPAIVYPNHSASALVASASSAHSSPRNFSQWSGSGASGSKSNGTLTAPE